MAIVVGLTFGSDGVSAFVAVSIAVGISTVGETPSGPPVGHPVRRSLSGRFASCSPAVVVCVERDRSVLSGLDLRL